MKILNVWSSEGTTTNEDSHGKYEDDTVWEGPTMADELSDFDREELDRAIALSIAEDDEKIAAYISDEDDKGKKVIDNESQLEEDEQLAKALQASLNVEFPPRSPPPRYDNGSFFPPYPFYYPSGSSFRCPIIAHIINLAIRTCTTPNAMFSKILLMDLELDTNVKRRELVLLRRLVWKIVPNIISE
ncbi:hypothetical protein BUALT_Bualt01G0188500 [Buddleja alternifolia]|uniref:Uncharacterized protein n=1 Tax=Buddleja alternifolia TaxID=168488 RepID=A0AAV6YCH7_9LAMI|nr:hypothetical protein BUALT_Bualt01G0188500 [Buddleja alternifolia]